ncbi:neuromedin-B [Tiliqua scincoides]|uniref:neuromedin-B n=1 Tax=Tiliqua scincoides TaxID=71010 RepID=UPI003462E18E
MAARGLASRVLVVGALAYLLLFFTISVSPAFGDKRNGPFRLRENLWATGHFMGKKSSPVSSHVQSSSPERADTNNIPEGFSPVLTGVLEDMKDLLMRELLKILLQEKLLEENQRKQDLKDQETPSLMNMLVKYI